MVSEPSQLRQYDLEERTLRFAQSVRDFLRRVPRTPSNTVYIPQLLRSSSSIGANYIEAHDALGRKDFFMKMKTSRREARESAYWLRLVVVGDAEALQNERDRLLDESMQLTRIFSAIVARSRPT